MVCSSVMSNERVAGGRCRVRSGSGSWPMGRTVGVVQARATRGRRRAGGHRGGQVVGGDLSRASRRRRPLCFVGPASLRTAFLVSNRPRPRARPHGGARSSNDGPVRQRQPGEQLGELTGGGRRPSRGRSRSRSRRRGRGGSGERTRPERGAPPVPETSHGVSSGCRPPRRSPACARAQRRHDAARLFTSVHPDRDQRRASTAAASVTDRRHPAGPARKQASRAWARGSCTSHGRREPDRDEGPEARPERERPLARGSLRSVAIVSPPHPRRLALFGIRRRWWEAGSSQGFGFVEPDHAAGDAVDTPRSPLDEGAAGDLGEARPRPLRRLEQQADGLALAQRDVEVAEQSRAEYAQVDLAVPAARLGRAGRVQIRVQALGYGALPVARVGAGWCLLDGGRAGAPGGRAPHGAASVRGLSPLRVPAAVGGPLARLGLGSRSAG